MALSMMAGGSAWAWEGSSDRRFVLEFETGAIWQSRNQIQIPDSADGTRFNLADLQGNGPEAHRRVELTWNVNHRHALRFVYAPIGFSGSGNGLGAMVMMDERITGNSYNSMLFGLTPIYSPFRPLAVATSAYGFHS